MGSSRPPAGSTSRRNGRCMPLGGCPSERLGGANGRSATWIVAIRRLVDLTPDPGCNAIPIRLWSGICRVVVLTGAADGGCDEIHVVYTQFNNMGSQETRVRRVLPIEVVDEIVTKESGMPFPLYEFEPGPEAVLDGLLPRYIDQTVYLALLMAAASEHAARRRAMKSATDNAEELIRSLSRQANPARQAEITQENSENVGGADALSA